MSRSNVAKRQEVHDLPERMDAGVRPAAGCRSSLATAQLINGFLKGLLNCPQARLPLPAMKIGAVVAEGQFDVPHQFGQLSVVRRPL